MSELAHPDRPPAPPGAGFALEALGWADGVLTLTGSWTGVRGMRFVRPTLTTSSPEGVPQRLLASLDDKPWTAAEGEPWRAAFPCPRPPAPGVGFELTVGAGIVVELPPVDGGEAPTGRFPREDAAPEPDADVAEAREQLATVLARLDLMRSERDAALGRLDTAREERQELAMARERAEADVRRVTRERDAALEERDAARSERAEMRRERDAARKEADAAHRRRDAALKQRDGMERERDKRREELGREREKLAAERETAKRRRKEHEAELKALRGEVAALQGALQAERSRPPAPAEPPPLPLRDWHAPWRQAAPATDARMQRALAAVALLAVLLLLVILL